MPQVTNTDIRELKDLIQSLDRKMDLGFANADKKMDLGFANADKKMELEFSNADKQIELGFSDLKGEIKTVNSRLTNLESNTKAIADLAEKVGELKNWKQIAIVLFTSVVTGTIGWLIRGRAA
jgi:hypothetical protein